MIGMWEIGRLMIGDVGNRRLTIGGMWEIGRLMIGDVGNREAYDRGCGK